MKGEVFRTHKDYIIKKEGEDGPRKVEEKMAELEVPIKFDEIKSFEWVNEGKSALTIVVAKEIFNWTDEDVFEMGRFAIKFSFIIKVMMQYIVSIDSIVNSAQKYWSKHFDFGSLLAEINKEEKKIILRETDFNTHVDASLYHAGYYQGLCELAIKSTKVTCRQTRFITKGDPYNEYLITWE